MRQGEKTRSRENRWIVQTWWVRHWWPARIRQLKRERDDWKRWLHDLEQKIDSAPKVKLGPYEDGSVARTHVNALTRVLGNIEPGTYALVKIGDEWKWHSEALRNGD